MQAHLRLHFETEEASDEVVLQAYPATIRCLLSICDCEGLFLRPSCPHPTLALVRNNTL